MRNSASSKMHKILTALSVLNMASSADIRKRFEYQWSFKGPQLISPQSNAVPFWQHFGHAIPSEDQVRITPSLRSRSGSIWNKYATTFTSWEIEVWLRISGKGRIGADGMAIWFTKEQGPNQLPTGHVFGAKDQWNGLMIALDSFDNNARQDNPQIGVMVNDGTQAFDHPNDGVGQLQAKCLRDYRNKVYPVKLRIVYRKDLKKLVLFYDRGLTDFDNYEVCAEVNDIELPDAGYFGVSAATGGLADDHDVIKFLTSSIHEPKEEPKAEVNEELKKRQEAYEKRKKELEEMRRKQAEQDPNSQQTSEQIDVNDLELKRIYETTSAIHRHVLQSSSVLSEVQAHLKKVAAASMSGVAGGDSVTKMDLNNLKIQSAELLSTIHGMKATMTRLENMNFGAGGTGAAAIGGLPAHQQTQLAGTKSNTDSILKVVKEIDVKMNQDYRRGPNDPAPCDTAASKVQCATSGTIMMFTVIQSVLIVALLTYLQKSGFFINKQKFF